MSLPPDPSSKREELHRKTEERVRSTYANPPSLVSQELPEVLHELHFYHADLEVQNEELRRTQVALEEARDLYFDLYDLAPVGYLSLNEAWLIKRGNLTAADMLGVPRRELTGQTLSRFIDNDHNDRFLTYHKKVSEAVGKEICELLFATATGKSFYAQMECAPERGDQGEFTGCRTVLVDITQRKRLEANLESEILTRSILLDNIPDCIALILKKGTREIVASNKLAQETGAVPGQICFMTCAVRKENDSCPFCLAPKMWATGQSQKIEVACEGKWYKAIWEPLSDDLYVHYIFDITGRKQAEEKTKQQQYYLEKAQELGRIGMWELDLKKNRLYWADENCRFFGIPTGTAMSYEKFLEKVHPDDQKYVDRKWAAARRGKPYDIEHRLLIDGTIKWVREKADVTFDKEGTAIRGIGFNQDITERKLAEKEKRRLESQLRQPQKMEAIGTLAGGIAHDFNNILSAIIGYSEMALDSIPDGSEASEDIKQVLKAGCRAEDLVRQILSFSRMDPQEEVPVQISQLLSESLKMLRPAIPTTIEIKQDIQNAQDKILADPVQIQQIIINLCTNAAQAMEDNGGIMQIGLTTVDLDEKQASEHLDLKPGKYQKLTISDTGVGMDETTLSRAFEPFYTTKDVGQGTGMGLSVVHGIVKSHDGAITVESELGNGSIFMVHLPIYEGEETTIDGPKNDKPLGGDERILLVDDEEALAATGKAKLQRLGYQVTAATSSVKALEYFKKYPDTFDLIITDYTMPEMTGTTLSKEILAIRPDIPIIIATGFSRQLTPEKAYSVGIKRMEMKPLVGDRFAHVVREVLDEAKNKRGTNLN